MTRVLVTGADGFIGRALVAQLRQCGQHVVSVARHAGDARNTAIGDIAGFTQWPELLTDVDVVIHLAARAHVMRERSEDPLSEFRRVNCQATLALAKAAAQAGARRFVFLSSIGVNGKRTFDCAFCEENEVAPLEPYARSKWEAEQALLQLGSATDMQITRIRPPLVVGAGVKGNLRLLLRLVDSRVPLPLAAVRNRRSFVAVEDLCDLIVLCSSEAAAANELFLAADPQAISTPQLLRSMGAGLERRPVLFPLPTSFLNFAATLCGVREPLGRLTGSLLVNGSKAQRLLGWQPRIGILAGIERMARAYRAE